MTGHRNTNQVQGRSTGPAALTPRVRRELEQRANVFSSDGSVVVTPTSRGTDLQLASVSAPDVTGTISWDTDTKILTISPDFIATYMQLTQIRDSSHTYDPSQDTPYSASGVLGAGDVGPSGFFQEQTIDVDFSSCTGLANGDTEGVALVIPIDMLNANFSTENLAKVPSGLLFTSGVFANATTNALYTIDSTETTWDALASSFESIRYHTILGVRLTIDGGIVTNATITHEQGSHRILNQPGIDGAGYWIKITGPASPPSYFKYTCDAWKGAYFNGSGGVNTPTATGETVFIVQTNHNADWSNTGLVVPAVYVKPTPAAPSGHYEAAAPITTELA